MNHETFYLERDYNPQSWERLDHGKYFAFCKTARKPYDLLVVAVLFAAKHRLGHALEFSSDGDNDELMEGYNFWRATCQPEGKHVAIHELVSF